MTANSEENASPENVTEVKLTNEENNKDDDDICELEHLRKLFIGGLSPQSSEDSLREFYGQWGNVVDVVVMRDPTTKRSRGFGFITYSKASMVDKAQENRPHVIDGKTVEAKRALQRPQRETREVNITVKKLFVGGLKDNHDEDCLKEYFSQFGNVISVKILSDKTTGKRRGFAFIEYDDYDSVDKAILQKTHTIKYVVVDVKKSIYKQENKKFNNGNSDEGNANSNTKGNLKNAPQASNGARAANVPAVPLNHGNQQPPTNVQPPPPNYNWGPPPPGMSPQYGFGGYPHPPPPNMNWSYPPGPNGWNGGPPHPPVGPPPNWYPNNWGYPQPPGPTPPVPPAPGTAPPPAGNWNNAPVPPPGVAPTNAPAPQKPPVPPNNFGTGYQQNYGGGPAKHNNLNGNRVNPYGPPPHANYANNKQPPPPNYGGPMANNGPGPGPSPVPRPVASAAGPGPGNNYRR